MLKTYIFHVSGTHCASCKILIEDVLSEQAFIRSFNVDLGKEIVEIEIDSDQNIEELAQILNSKIKNNGYTLSVEKIVEKKQNNDVIWKALPVGLLFLALFFIFQKSGILSFGLDGKVTPVTSFIIGLVASVSSCLTIVGGLVLSLSAKVEQEESNKSTKKMFFLFHGGRLLGFALLGGVLGSVGGILGVNFIFSSILGILTSLVMILLGINLLGILKKNKFTMPSHLFSFFRKIEYKTLTPLIIGVGTFFLPCGFTQSMQVVAVSSGSFVSGSLIMFAFALGTFPMLAFLSFGSASLAHSKHAPLFFKSAGVVVMGLGLFALLAGLAGLGIINPLFNI